MSSLGDKLRAIKPIVKAGPRPAASACRVVEERLPLRDVPPPAVSRDALAMMLGTPPDRALSPGEYLFLDTETTGLSRGVGTLAFLCGAGWFEGDAFVVRQFLMRDYDEEPFVLEHVRALLASRPALVTFNGAAFDVPLLMNRWVMNRMDAPAAPPLHVDLLHVARRVYKLRLQRCSLAALEESVFGMQREEDLPGAMVPERYFRYLNTRDDALLDDILRHNRQDIVSLALLMNRLAALHERPLSAGHHEEIFSLGRLFEKRGEAGRARQCYRAVNNGRFSDLAAIRIAETYRRAKDPARAATVYERLLSQGKGRPQVYIALAKLYEFRLQQPATALEIARRGMLYCLETPGEDCAEALADLKRRYARLFKKNGGI